MSVKKLLSIIGVGIFVGGAVVYLQSKDQSHLPTRFPSSVRHGKAHATFQVKISGPSLNELPSDEEAEIVLSADILALSQVQGDLKYQWIVNDPDLVFDKDSMSGELVGVQKGQQVKDVTLRLSGFSKKGAPNRVTLQVWSENGAGVATYAPFDKTWPSENEGTSFKSMEMGNQPQRIIHQ